MVVVAAVVEVVCGEIGLDSGCMSVGRAYVSWFWGWGSSCSCCLRFLERGSLAVYQWVLGLAGEEVIFFTCCKYKCEMRYFATVYDIGFGIRF